MANDSEVLFERIINQNDEKGVQIRVVVNNFRGVEYFHLRKYFLSFDEDYVPTKEGISMPMSIENIYTLLDALVEICANSESIDSITKHFEQKIIDLKE